MRQRRWHRVRGLWEAREPSRIALMRHAFVRSVPGLVLLSLLPAQNRGDRGAAPAAAKLANFTVETGTVKSDKVRDGQAGYDIYLPKGYADEANKDTKYPLVLWLHGFGGPNEFQGDGGAGVLDTLRGADKVPPFVMVVYRAPGRRTTYMNGERAADAEDLIVTDLVDQLEAQYRVGGSREKRALMGVSMGGLGALKIAMRHPDRFGVVAAHSAAILPADPADLPEQYAGMVNRMVERNGLDKVLGNPIDKAKWAEQMPLGLVASKKPEEWKSLHIYFDAGTEDRYDFCPPNESLDKVMTEKGIKHLFRKIDGGGHAWSSPSMHECLAISLQFVGAAFAGKDPIEVATAAAKPAEKKADPKPATGENSPK